MQKAKVTARSTKSTQSPSFRKKLFYRIQEAAEIAGLKPYVLRYWETQFAELSPKKDGNDQRRYKQEDIEVVLKIKELLYGRKYTIAGARQFLKSSRAASRKSSPKSDLRSIRAELMDLMKRLSA